MSPLWLSVAAIGGLLLSLIGSGRASREGQPVVRLNYAGRPVPVVLGGVLVRAANTALLVAFSLALLAGPVRAWEIPLLVFGGSYLLFLVGTLDDRSTSETRGIRAHVSALARGGVTTGIWKLVTGAGIAVLLAVQLGGGLGRVIVSALVIALSINVTNAMDVRPGRALKWAALWLLPISVFAVATRSEAGVVLAAFAYMGSGFGVLPSDLGEKGMLGDAGSNPLGLVLGTVLAAVLPQWGLVAALAALLGLQIAAETVTISRLIEAVPPLRWFDRLGRRN